MGMELTFQSPKLRQKSDNHSSSHRIKLHKNMDIPSNNLNVTIIMILSSFFYTQIEIKISNINISRFHSESSIP